MCCTVMVGHPALVGATRVWSHSNEVSAWVVLGHWLTFVHPMTAICIVGLDSKGNKLSKRKALRTCWLPFQNVWPEWDCMRQQKELHCYILYLQMRQRMTQYWQCVTASSVDNSMYVRIDTLLHRVGGTSLHYLLPLEFSVQFHSQLPSSTSIT